MTLKEQIMKLQTYKMHEGEDTVYVERDDVLKALEQEPCVTMRDLSEEELKHFSEEMKRIRPQVIEREPKTGHWIENAEEYYKAINEKGGGVNDNTPYFDDDIACSECLAKFSIVENEVERFDYCPNCGAKMIEPQESE